MSPFSRKNVYGDEMDSQGSSDTPSAKQVIVG
jgi:hypothetical protein